jgi:DNA primase
LAEQVRALQHSKSGDDRLECEFFQILFTEPRMMQLFREEIGPDEFQHAALRELWAVCLDFLEEGELPTFDRVLTRLDCPDLKRLVVWIDDEARHKDVAGLLVADQEQDEPAFVRELLERMKFRREKTRHETWRLDRQAPPAPEAGLTEEAKQMLQEATRYHERRQAK